MKPQRVPVNYRTRRGTRGRGGRHVKVTPGSSEWNAERPDYSSQPSQRAAASSAISRTQGPTTLSSSASPSWPYTLTSTPPTKRTNGTLARTLRILWWNIEHASTVWFNEDFWHCLEEFDLVFLLETHHTAVPIRAGWKVLGQERPPNHTAGGVLALIRAGSPMTFDEPEYPFDGVIWLTTSEFLTADGPLSIGGVYVPHASDPRFRSLQGNGHADHFDSLEDQLTKRAQQAWIVGGDFNSITNQLQPSWTAHDPLDHLAPTRSAPKRISDDKRPLNAHGRRLLQALGNEGMILNGQVDRQFDSAFTRLPQRHADCPGVIDYICANGRALKQLPDCSLRVLDSCADFSDHRPLALQVKLEETSGNPDKGTNHFIDKRLPILKVPDDPTVWISIESDVAAELESTSIQSDLESCLAEGAAATIDNTVARNSVDKAMDGIIDILHRTFQRYRLIGKRSFGSPQLRKDTARGVAPPSLRAARLEASKAQREYCQAVKGHVDTSTVTSLKSRWNKLSSRCRALSKAVRAQQCTELRNMWKRLRTSAPRQMWATFRRYTHQPEEGPQCTPDQEWEHWASQGDVHEPVWIDTIKTQAETMVEKLRGVEFNGIDAPTDEEVEAGRKRLRPGRSPGLDGIPTDVIKNLDCLLPICTLLFAVMFRFAVYPKALGIAIIRSILKPNKPKHLPSSLRGIRLLSSFAAWFGQILDNKTRQMWQAGCEQFGFRKESGCAEAVSVLVALIHSRTSKKKRLYVLWIDLRTAFPSLNRAILILRILECGLGIGLARVILSVLDLTTSVLCVGKLVGNGFMETLGTREGAVESPHLFNIYIGALRKRLEEEHPHRCQLLHVSIAILLYADDAAIPADSPDDLAALAASVERFCNEMHLFISTAKTYITVFHHEGDDSVAYEGDSVYVDGSKVELFIYTDVIKAASTFKYLGVELDEYGSPHAHLDRRLTALLGAGHSLLRGFKRIPTYTHSLVQYLWQSLVQPVGCYGTEVYGWKECDVSAHQAEQIRLWKRLLNLGSRAPNDATTALMGIDCLAIELKVRRVAHLLRLLNAPPDTLQHAALVYFISAEHFGFTESLRDLRVVFPSVDLRISNGTPIPFVYSTGRWNDVGEWCSAQPYILPCDCFGRRQRTPLSRKHVAGEADIVRKHVRRVSQQLRLRLRRDTDSHLICRIQARGELDRYAKTLLLEQKLRWPGVPISVALDWTGPPRQCAAVSAFFAGEFFLARYCGNYFAKSLIPSGARNVARAKAIGIEPTRVCLCCWHSFSALHLEDEAHVVFRCAKYDVQRTDLISSLSEHRRNAIADIDADPEKLRILFSSSSPEEWNHIGRFLFRVRQVRRRMKQQMMKVAKMRDECSFNEARRSWRSSGKHVCRHGVLYERAFMASCPCLAPVHERDWTEAMFMAALDHDLKCVVAIPFDANNFTRLGIVQAEMRRLNW